jgi:hypothetical protein
MQNNYSIKADKSLKSLLEEIKETTFSHSDRNRFFVDADLFDRCDEDTQDCLLTDALTHVNDSSLISEIDQENIFA